MALTEQINQIINKAQVEDRDACLQVTQELTRQLVDSTVRGSQALFEQVKQLRKRRLFQRRVFVKCMAEALECHWQKANGSKARLLAGYTAAVARNLACLLWQLHSKQLWLLSEVLQVCATQEVLSAGLPCLQSMLHQLAALQSSAERAQFQAAFIGLLSHMVANVYSSANPTQHPGLQRLTSTAVGLRAPAQAVLKSLRHSWAPSAAAAAESGGGDRVASSGGPQMTAAGAALLADVVAVVHGFVLPQAAAHRYLLDELSAALQPACTPNVPSEMLLDTSTGPFAELIAVAAAFVSALPGHSVRECVQQALAEGRADWQLAIALLRCLAAVDGIGCQDMQAMVEASVASAIELSSERQLKAALLVMRSLADLIVPSKSDSRNSGKFDQTGPSSITAGSAAARGTLQQQTEELAGYAAWFGRVFFTGADGTGKGLASSGRALAFLVGRVLLPAAVTDPLPILHAHQRALSVEVARGQVSGRQRELVAEYLCIVQQRLQADQQAIPSPEVKSGLDELMQTKVKVSEAAARKVAQLMAQAKVQGCLPAACLQELKNPFKKPNFRLEVLPALLVPTADDCERQLRLRLIEELAAKHVPGVSNRDPANFDRACRKLARRFGGHSPCAALQSLLQTEGAPINRLAEAVVDAIGDAQPSVVGALLDKLEAAVIASLSAPGGASDVVKLAALAEQLLITFCAGFCRSLQQHQQQDGTSAVAADVQPTMPPLAWCLQLLGILNRQPRLHAPLLGRLAELIMDLGPQLAPEQVAGLGGFMVFMGTLTRPCADTPSHRTKAATAAACGYPAPAPELPQPRYTWQLPVATSSLDPLRSFHQHLSQQQQRSGSCAAAPHGSMQHQQQEFDRISIRWPRHSGAAGPSRSFQAASTQLCGGAKGICSVGGDAVVAALLQAIPLGAAGRVGFGLRLCAAYLAAAGAFSHVRLAGLPDKDAAAAELEVGQAGPDGSWQEAVAASIPAAVVELLQWVHGRVETALQCALRPDELSSEARACHQVAAAALGSQLGEQLQAATGTALPLDSLLLLEARRGASGGSDILTAAQASTALQQTVQHSIQALPPAISPVEPPSPTIDMPLEEAITPMAANAAATAVCGAIAGAAWGVAAERIEPNSCDRVWWVLCNAQGAALQQLLLPLESRCLIQQLISYLAELAAAFMQRAALAAVPEAGAQLGGAGASISSAVHSRQECWNEDKLLPQQAELRQLLQQLHADALLRWWPAQRLISSGCGMPADDMVDDDGSFRCRLRAIEVGVNLFWRDFSASVSASDAGSGQQHNVGFGTDPFGRTEDERRLVELKRDIKSLLGNATSRQLGGEGIDGRDEVLS